MIPRRTFAAAGLALIGAPALAQQASRAGRQSQLPLPLPPPPPPDPDDLSEPAPVPNNNLEAPRDRADTSRPQINPALIDPEDPQAATSHDSNSLRAREDRLLRNPAPGARLRLPF